MDDGGNGDEDNSAQEDWLSAELIGEGTDEREGEDGSNGLGGVDESKHLACRVAKVFSPLMKRLRAVHQGAYREW